MALKHFKFLGFALGKNGKDVYVRVKIYTRGWIGYFYVADMKRILQSWRIAGSAVLNRSVTNEKLAQAGYDDFPAQYERLRHCT